MTIFSQLPGLGRKTSQASPRLAAASAPFRLRVTLDFAFHGLLRFSPGLHLQFALLQDSPSIDVYRPTPRDTACVQQMTTQSESHDGISARHS